MQRKLTTFAVLAVLLCGLVCAAQGLAVYYDGYFTNVLVKGSLQVNDDAAVTDDLAVGGDLAVTGTLTGVLGATTASVANYLTDTTLTAADSGLWITTSGAAAAFTLTMPEAEPGRAVCVANAEAYTVTLDPADGDLFLGITNASGDAIANATAGDTVCAVAVDYTEWAITGSRGTWVDAD